MPQISAPAPLSVNVPDAYVALPPTAGLPMSVASHGDGRATAATVKLTPLLATPPTVTTTVPVVAPLGTSATMLVALQLVGVASVPLNRTVLVPCVAPKFVPAIVTAVPTAPDVGVRLVMLGGDEPVALETAVPLNVAVARVETLWLVTASPTYTVAAIEMLSLPMSVQLVPVVDRYAETVEPLRTKRTQDGAVPAPPTVVALAPSVVTRRWNTRPFAGVTATNAFREPAP